MVSDTRPIVTIPHAAISVSIRPISVSVHLVVINLVVINQSWFLVPRASNAATRTQSLTGFPPINTASCVRYRCLSTAPDWWGPQWLITDFSFNANTPLLLCHREHCTVATWLARVPARYTNHKDSDSYMASSQTLRTSTTAARGDVRSPENPLSC